jgi:hypothetical protein
MWWAGPAMAHDMNQTNTMFNKCNGPIMNVLQRLRVGTWPRHRHLFPICQLRTHFSRWGQELGILMSIEQMTDISRLTEADKICISVVDLPMILIEALETFMNRILDFRELG